MVAVVTAVEETVVDQTVAAVMAAEQPVVEVMAEMKAALTVAALAAAARQPGSALAWPPKAAIIFAIAWSAAGGAEPGLDERVGLRQRGRSMHTSSDVGSENSARADAGSRCTAATRPMHVARKVQPREFGGRKLLQCRSQHHQAGSAESWALRVSGREVGRGDSTDFCTTWVGSNEP